MSGITRHYNIRTSQCIICVTHLSCAVLYCTFVVPVFTVYLLLCIGVFSPICISFNDIDMSPTEFLLVKHNDNKTLNP